MILIFEGITHDIITNVIVKYVMRNDKSLSPVNEKEIIQSSEFEIIKQFLKERTPAEVLELQTLAKSEILYHFPDSENNVSKETS